MKTANPNPVNEEFGLKCLEITVMLKQEISQFLLLKYQ